MCEKNVQSSKVKLPRLTIGIPVYNGEKFVRSALDSVIKQTFSDFEVIVSDNASTDGTSNICREYAGLDKRICYLRQDSNIGAFSNFEFLVKKASTPYFVFLAADDSWEPDFLSENIAALDNDATAVASISKVSFNEAGLFSRVANGTFGLQDTVLNNLRRYLLSIGDNSRFYSVFRTPVIQNAFKDSYRCHAADWLIMAITLQQGQHIETPNILMHRTDAKEVHYIQLSCNDNNNIFTKLFPVLPMTYFLILRIGLKYSIPLFGSILRLNINKHAEYVRLKYGVYRYLGFLRKRKK
jgi:glycosyltransferase involved in cell wall biosynthesis